MTRAIGTALLASLVALAGCGKAPGADIAEADVALLGERLELLADSEPLASIMTHLSGAEDPATVGLPLGPGEHAAAVDAWDAFLATVNDARAWHPQQGPPTSEQREAELARLAQARQDLAKVRSLLLPHREALEHRFGAATTRRILGLSADVAPR